MSALPVPGFGFDESRMRSWIGSRDAQPILTVDSHTAGNPTRIILAGVDLPAGVRTVAEVREWLRTERDDVRTRLVHEPRGGSLTCAVLPLPPTDDTHDIGAVILEPGSYPPMCGHCMIGLAGAVAELDLVGPDVRRIRIATPAGIVTAVVELGGERGVDVRLENVPSYVVGGWTAEIDDEPVAVTLSYGGDHYASVDARGLGVALERDNARELVRIAEQIRVSAEQRTMIDPRTGTAADVYQVMFYDHAPAEESAAVVVVAPPGAIDRSPCGTGSSALLALLVDAGAHDVARPLRTRSIIRSRFEVRAAAVDEFDGRPVVTPELRGSAYLTGFSWTVADPSDDLRDGFPPL